MIENILSENWESYIESWTLYVEKMDYGIDEVIMNIPFMLDNHDHNIPFSVIDCGIMIMRTKY
jgi:hypothetical protein